MKQFVSILILLLFLCNTAFAKDIDDDSQKEFQSKIGTIGYNLLNSNAIEQRLVFCYNPKKVANAGTSYSNRQITVYKGMMETLNSDDEIAAVLSHEISHGIDSYNGILRGFFTPMSYAFAPKKYEYKADKRGVDFMVNAGYNPVAMIIVLNKTGAQPRFDWQSSHPLTSRRMMEIYEYIYRKYPEFLANNQYKNNPIYQNFLLTSKENRIKFQNRVKTGSKSKARYK